MASPDSACVQSRDCELRRCAEDFAAAIERDPGEWKDAAHWLLEGHPPDSSQDWPIVGQLTIKCAELVRDAFGSQSPDRHLRQFGLEEATRVGLITALLADKDFDGGCVDIPWPWSAGEQWGNDRETAQVFALDNLPGSAWYRNVDDIWLTLVREAIRVLDKKRPRWRGEPAKHSADFTSVNWFGTRYEFNKTQAECIKLLWPEWEKGGLGLSERTIGEGIRSSSDRYRLVHTFRAKDGSLHPAWGTMIESSAKGIFRLSAPNHQ